MRAPRRRSGDGGDARPRAGARARRTGGGTSGLVGDPHQLPPVGAGGLFPALCERLGAIELSDNRHQRDLSERRALALLRAGEPEPYLAHAAKRGRLHLDDGPSEAKQRLLEDWWQVAQHDLAGSVMLAYRRADVRDLNEAARTVLTRAGGLGPDALEAGGLEFRVGDRVLGRRNDLALGVRNGTRGTVVELDPSALTLRTDRGLLRSLPLRYAEADLDHAYALTAHAAQGATVERVFVLFPDQGAVREWGYVACSRARAETHLYLAERDPLERETLLRDPNPTAPPERAARALERSSAEPLALHHTTRQYDASALRHARRREELDQRARVAEQLAAAQRELKKLHWWNRGCDRVQLEVEIASRHAALRSFDERRKQLERKPPPSHRLPLPGRDPDDLMATRSLRPEPRRQPLRREPPGLEL